jgi:hypothetical protein
MALTSTDEIFRPDFELTVDINKSFSLLTSVFNSSLVGNTVVAFSVEETIETMTFKDGSDKRKRK